MKVSAAIAIALSLILSGNAAAQYTYKQANQPKIEKIEKIESVIGKDFWVKFNGNARHRAEFYDEVGTFKNFYVTQDAHFKILSYVQHKLGDIYFKIRFDDGREAYLKANLAYQFDGAPILPRLITNKYERSIIGDKNGLLPEDEYFFDGEPSVVLAEIEKRYANAAKKLAQAKAEKKAEKKAKGGVQIGMSKARVLNSNWGKPSHVNRTTTADGEREQWVYGSGNYLYFTNGILTTIQN